VNFIENCRHPSFAGSFYPSEKFKLEEMVRNYIQRAEVPEEIRKQDISAILVPHAGYKYSGPVAGYSYKAVEGKNYTTVILMGPSHNFYSTSFILDNRDFYKTPLGLVEIDKEVINFLSKFERFETIPNIHDEEHSLEVQIPFIQLALGNVKLAPILFGDVSKTSMITMAEAIDKIINTLTDRKFLIISSSDLSHYHTYEEAYELDKKIAQIFESKDFEKYISYLAHREIEACGAGPLGALIYYAREKNKTAKVLKLLNSGDTSGPKDYVVGYMSGVVY